MPFSGKNLTKAVHLPPLLASLFSFAHAKVHAGEVLPLMTEYHGKSYHRPPTCLFWHRWLTPFDDTSLRSFPKTLSLPRAGVLCALHWRHHKKHVPLQYAVSRSLMILRFSVWPQAGEIHFRRCRAARATCTTAHPNKVQKHASAQRAYHPESWVCIARPVFSLDARNLAHTDKNTHTPSYRPRRKL